MPARGRGSGLVRMGGLRGLVITVLLMVAAGGCAAPERPASDRRPSTLPASPIDTAATTASGTTAAPPSYPSIPPTTPSAAPTATPGSPPGAVLR
jgi:hypothetical protein